MSKGVKIDTEYYFRVGSWEPQIAAAETAITNASATIIARALDSQKFRAAGPSLVTGLREVVSGVQSAALEAGGADFQARVQQVEDMAIAAGMVNGLSFPDTPEGRAAEAEYHAEQIKKADEDGYIPTSFEVEQVSQFMEENEDDPEVMKVFYEAVPAESLLNYTSSVRNMRFDPSRSRDFQAAQNDYITQFGPSLAKASRMGSLPPGYADDIVAAVETGSNQQRDLAAAELLGYGVYDTEFITTVTDGLLKFEMSLPRINGSANGWTFNDGYRLGYAPTGPALDPVDAALGAMVRAGDNDALYNVMYVNAAPGTGGRNAYEFPGRVEYLAGRTWSDGGTNFALGLEGLSTDPTHPERSGAIASDAIRFLPPNYAATEPPIEARQSFANILAYHWQEAATVSLARESTSTASKLAPPPDYMNLPDPVTDFTRAELDEALGVVMDLNDFDPDAELPAELTPTATIMGAFADFGAYEAARTAGFQSNDPALVNEKLVVGSIDNSVQTLAFITTAGFEDDVQEGKDHDAMIANFENFTATVVSSAVGLGIGKIPIAGTVAPAVAKTAGTWGAKSLTEAFFPESNVAADMEEELCGFQGTTEQAIMRTWGVTVAATASPIEGEPDLLRGPGGPNGVVINLSGIEGLDFDVDGKLDIENTPDSALNQVADRVEDAYGVSSGSTKAERDAGGQRANGDAEPVPVENCPS